MSERDMRDYKGHLRDYFERSITKNQEKLLVRKCNAFTYSIPSNTHMNYKSATLCQKLRSHGDITHHEEQRRTFLPHYSTVRETTVVPVKATKFQNVLQLFKYCTLMMGYGKSIGHCLLFMKMTVIEECM